jgi:predicted kinase
MPSAERRPRLVVVTGPPASGKTSVAEELAKRLELPFVSKDTFKERLYEHFGSGEELEERIDAAALAIVFSVAESQLRAGVSVAIESNFDADSDVGPIRQVAETTGAGVVQVHVGGDVDGLVETFARRAAEGRRHPGHRDDPADADELRAKLEAGHWRPLDLPGVLVRADMHETEAAIVERIRDAL